MESLELSRGYRWYAYLFGVIGPVLVWTLGFIATFEDQGYAKPDSWLVGALAMFVVFEAAALSLWISRDSRGHASELVLAIVLALGALFAAAWCALGLYGLISDFDGFGLFALLFVIIPAPSVVIYGLSAFHAFKNSRQLARRMRALPEPGWPRSRTGLG